MQMWTALAPICWLLSWLLSSTFHGTPIPTPFGSRSAGSVSRAYRKKKGSSKDETKPLSGVFLRHSCHLPPSSTLVPFRFLYSASNPFEALVDGFCSIFLTVVSNLQSQFYSSASRTRILYVCFFIPCWNIITLEVGRPRAACFGGVCPKPTHTIDQSELQIIYSYCHRIKSRIDRFLFASRFPFFVLFCFFLAASIWRVLNSPVVSLSRW